ncbi:hypothetical protein AAHA92_29434 [Salvia divinorum]|uniref:Uncharacterized protein n=1 Tax=Salvia divinorum TaxID=28513 RepID=A0ABD1FYW0_SALDI
MIDLDKLVRKTTDPFNNPDPTETVSLILIFIFPLQKNSYFISPSLTPPTRRRPSRPSFRQTFWKRMNCVSLDAAGAAE